MLEKIPRVYWVGGIIAAILAFSIYSTLYKKSLRTLSVSRFDVPSIRFAGIETLRNARSEELIAEIAKVIEQNGLPADVFLGLSSNISDEEKRIQQSTNIAITLHDQFHKNNLQNPNDLRILWETSPVGAWDVDERQLESVQPLLQQLEPRRRAIRSMLEEWDTHFYYIFVHPESSGSFRSAPASPQEIRRNVREATPQSAISSRFATTVVNTEASEYLADYALLEEYVVAQALLEGNIEEAMEALDYVFRITYLASMLGNVGTRADAAAVRLRAFEVMQRIVLDPKFEKAHLIKLRNILLEERKNWTSEYVAWFGDRASGMMLYHNVMLRGLNALEPAELASLDERGVTGRFNRGFMKYHEQDKIFYLRSMQKILDVSEEPFTKRLDVLSQIQTGLLATEHTYDDEGIAKEHFVANIMLKEVDRFMRLFAADQAALDRAIVAILRSLDQGGTERYRNPFTDEPYEVRKVDGLLSISTTFLPRPFRVPIFTD
jgi:hypothetical protein